MEMDVKHISFILNASDFQSVSSVHEKHVSHTSSEKECRFRYFIVSLQE